MLEFPEEKATFAACAVLPSADDAATKMDIALLSSTIERLEASTKVDITGLKKDIERLRADAKANSTELKVDFLRWMAIMLGLIVNLSLGG